ncbi:MAG: extracellular solute-binding protein, partial [Anaerolineales bacterium]|nr:extracellular solute-binding protein [Anaerolineales bacterium]
MSKYVSRRDFLKIVGITGASAVLARCRPAKLTPEVALTTKFKKTDLVAPSWWGPHEIPAAEKSFAGKFHQDTGLNLKYEFVGEHFHEKVLTNLVTDDPYDVITFDAGSVPMYMNRDLLTPLNDFITRDNYDTSNIVPSALSQWTYD